MGVFKQMATLPNRAQPVRHILSRERRHREMKQREDKFARMLADMQKKRQDKKEANHE